jgi:hypothetical protein
VALDSVQPMPPTMLQGAFDELYPSGDHWYRRAEFVNEIPDEAVERNRPSDAGATEGPAAPADATSVS